MKFRRQQCEQMAATWNAGSWFFNESGLAIRALIATAYEVYPHNKHTPVAVAKAQESIGVALEVFARKVGCGKGQAVHALLSGRVDRLVMAIGHHQSHQPTLSELKEAWEASFRDTLTGRL